MMKYRYFSKGDFFLPKICMYVATGWLIILLTIEIMKIAHCVGPAINTA